MSRSGLHWIKLINEFMNKTKKFEQHIKKIKPISLDNGKYKAEFVVNEDDLNGNKEFHEGLTATLIDVTSAHALFSQGNGYMGVSTNIHISNFERAFVGDVLLIDAKVCSLKDRLASVKVELSKKNGKEVVAIARGQHTLFVTPFTDHPGYKP